MSIGGEAPLPELSEVEHKVTIPYPFLKFPFGVDPNTFSDQQKQVFFKLNSVWAWANDFRRSLLKSNDNPEQVHTLAGAAAHYMMLENVLADPNQRSAEDAQEILPYLSTEKLPLDDDSIITIPPEDLQEIAKLEMKVNTAKHEIRNGVTKVSARSQLIERFASRGKLDQVEGSKAILTRLSSNYLNFHDKFPSGFEHGNIFSYLSYGGLEESIKNAWVEQPEISISPLNFENIRKEQKTIFWSESSITSFIDNCIQNAKRSGADNIACVITILPADEANNLPERIAVQLIDNGQGISDEFLLQGIQYGKSAHATGEKGEGIALATLDGDLRATGNGAGITVVNRTDGIKGAVVTAILPIY